MYWNALTIPVLLAVLFTGLLSSATPVLDQQRPGDIISPKARPPRPPPPNFASTLGTATSANAKIPPPLPPRPHGKTALAAVGTEKVQTVGDNINIRPGADLPARSQPQIVASSIADVQPKASHGAIKKTNVKPDKSLPVQHAEDLLTLRSLAMAYQETGDPSFKNLMQSTLEKIDPSRIIEPIKKVVQREAKPNFWERMNSYAQTNIAFLDHSKKKNIFRRLGLSFFRKVVDGAHVSVYEFNNFADIRGMIRDFVPRKYTLTGTLLSFRGTTKLPEHEQLAFERSIFAAFLFDAKNKALSDKGMKEITKTLGKVTHRSPWDKRFGYDLLRSAPVKKTVSESKLNLITQMYNVELFQYDHPEVDSTRINYMQRNKKLTEDAVREKKDYLQSQVNKNPGFDACGKIRSTARFRRSLAGKCLVTEEEYREIVKSVEEEGAVEKIVDTEKYLDLLDRVTAEEPAAKRQQLLELGEKLANDPKVVLEGDYVSQFYDVVSRLEDISQRDLSMPQNPLERFNAPQDGGRLPSEYISPGELHPLSQPEYMHTVNVHEFSAKPVDFHEQIMPLKELPYHSYSTDIFKPSEEFSRIPLPEITHVMEIPKPHIPFELPIIERPIFKLTLPTFRRG